MYPAATDIKCILQQQIKCILQQQIPDHTLAATDNCLIIHWQQQIPDHTLAAADPDHTRPSAEAVKTLINRAIASYFAKTGFYTFIEIKLN